MARVVFTLTSLDIQYIIGGHGSDWLGTQQQNELNRSVSFKQKKN